MTPIMPKAARLLIGLITVCPVTLIVLVQLFGGLLLIMDFYGVSDDKMQMENMKLILQGSSVIYISAFILAALLLIFYTIHVFYNTKITNNQRIPILILLLLGNIIAMPIYWFIYILMPTKSSN